MKKLKLIVVDDEPYTRDCLVEFIQEIKGFDVTGSFANGRGALDSITRAAPDIVITDVRMPAMDGLALAEILRSQYPGIKVIIISGYKDFEYAKAAITHGALGYLLKPLDLDELVSVLHRATQSIHAERNKKRTLTLRDVYSAIIRGDFITECDGDIEAFEKIEQLFHNVLLIQILEGKAPEAMEVYIEEILKEKSGAYLTEFSGNALLVLGSDSPEALCHDSKRITDGILGLMKNADCKFCLSLSQIEKGAEVLPLLHSQALNISNLRYLLGDNRVYAATESYPTSESLNNQDETLIMEVISSILQKDSASAYAYLDNIIAGFEKSRTPLQEVLSFFKYLVIKATMSLFYDDAVSELSAQYLHQIYTCGQVDGVFALMHNFIADCIGFDKKGKQEAYILQAKDYIHLNFREPDLTVGKIAEHFHLAPSYFSTLFADHTGIKASNYITQKRMDFAMEQLLHTKDSIDAIAERAGYMNSNYFYKVFKQNIGVTPKEFRKKEEST